MVLSSCTDMWGAVTSTRVDTQVSFVGNSREFHAKRVSYFAKKRSLFCEILCFAKLALACESQFRMFRPMKKQCCGDGARVDGA